MRNINRIPIILQFFLRNFEVYNNFVNDNNYLIHGAFKLNIVKITHEWTKYPDYRFGQLLYNMNLLSNDSSYNIEEVDWLIKNNYFKPEDILFWGSMYDKDENLLSETKYILLKDLELEHIKNIIKYFERHKTIDKIDKRYLKYFNERINNEG